MQAPALPKGPLVVDLEIEEGVRWTCFIHLSPIQLEIQSLFREWDTINSSWEIELGSKILRL